MPAKTKNTSVEEPEAPEGPQVHDWTPFLNIAVVIHNKGRVEPINVPAKKSTSPAEPDTEAKSFHLYKNEAFNANGQIVLIQAWCSVESGTAQWLQTFFENRLVDEGGPALLMFPAMESLRVNDYAFRLRTPNSYQVDKTQIKKVLNLGFAKSGVQATEKLKKKLLPTLFDWNSGSFKLNEQPLPHPSTWSPLAPPDEESDDDEGLEDLASPGSTRRLSIAELSPPPAKKAKTTA